MVGLEVRKEPWDKHQLFGAIPLMVFLAEGKDGLACWEQLFCIRSASRSLFPCAGRGAGGPYVENVPWDWACLAMFFRKVVGFMGTEPKSPP